jgi:hypothetical protein
LWLKTDVDREDFTGREKILVIFFQMTYKITLHVNSSRIKKLEFLNANEQAVEANSIVEYLYRKIQISYHSFSSIWYQLLLKGYAVFFSDFIKTFTEKCSELMVKIILVMELTLVKQLGRSARISYHSWIHVKKSRRKFILFHCWESNLQNSNHSRHKMNPNFRDKSVKL